MYKLTDEHKKKLRKNEVFDDIESILSTCKHLVYFGTIEYIEKETKYVNLDGMEYIGQINNNKERNGFGITCYSEEFIKNNKYNIKTYIGEYKNDYKNGIGELKYVDSSLYIGEWEKNKKSGYGYKFTKEKYTYNGSWKDNKLCGYGELEIPDKVLFKCNWLNNLPDGIVKRIFKNGIIEYSEWTDGIEKESSKVTFKIENEIKNPIFENYISFTIS